MRVPRRVLLRLKQRIKVPETARVHHDSTPHCASWGDSCQSMRNAQASGSHLASQAISVAKALRLSAADTTDAAVLLR